MNIRLSTLACTGLLSALPLLAAACPGQVAALYTDHGNGSITDKQTGLMWQQCSIGTDAVLCSGTATDYSWQQALAVVQSINSNAPAGHNNWRLPSVAELNTLADTACHAPAINAGMFPATLTAQYWTASPSAADGSKAWVVDFTDGSSSAISKISERPIRLVRDAK